MKCMKRLAALAVAAAAVLTPATAQADTPYAQASAVVGADGSLLRAKNVLRSWRADTGDYCVVLGENVNLEDSVAVNATLLGSYPAARSLSVEFKSETCGMRHHEYTTIAVHSVNAFGRPSDVAFFLTVS
ncbi:hypothetical protein ITP53_38640 [Nonomuraea sp. K274]|uniref:Uncharacterized protein n=1 Tax=Nonomuraea cypriaca TaxID=1187855 RepID=A0A931AJV9_9ACTN|nr:hypothetical protein [Nonomuraea cypriaca]MBF8191515.1 hypothetical protein [Nonomuraea cypriaca]